MTPAPPVTAVIPTVDRPDELHAAVQSVVDQDYAGDIEVIVVVDAPETVPVGVELPAGRTLRVVTNHRAKGLAGARNTGIMAAAHGHVAFLDDDGYLHLVDRASDVVVVVGGHVYTSELEDTLMSHDGVRQAAVFGVPDADGVETVHAAVVPTSPAPGERELDEHVARCSGDMYVPEEIAFVDELPLTDIGKTDKKALRAQFWTGDRAVG